MKREKLRLLTKKPFKWLDLVLIAAFALMLILPYVLVKRDAGGRVEIYRDNMLIAEFDLNRDAEYTFSNRGIDNLIVIKDGTVRVAEATCPDKLCCQMRPISRENEVILCIPSGLKVTVKGVPPVVDGVAKEGARV